jgi:pilus assembly protein Flp/PilA
MNKFARSVMHFLVEEDGPTAVEYAVMLSLIVVVCLAAVGEIGHQSRHTFEDAATALN